MLMVGMGNLVPNLEAMARETPSTLKRMIVSCINYERKYRPLFPQVLANVENILQSAAEKESKFKTTAVDKDIDVEIDEGNLLCIDPNQLDVKKLK